MAKTELPPIPKGAVKIDDPDVTIGQLLSIIHYLLEDESVKRKKFGHFLDIRAEFMSKDEKIFNLEAIATNENYVCTAFRYYDKKLGDWHYYNWKSYDKLDFDHEIEEGDEVKQK